MNIFVLDLDPRRCARYHCDFHVGKMITETAQIRYMGEARGAGVVCAGARTKQPAN